MNKKREISVSHHLTTQQRWTLKITITNIAVDVWFMPWQNDPGNDFQIMLCDLDPDEVLKLANLITAEAFKMRAQEVSRG